MRVGHLRTQVLPDALGRQPLAQTRLDLLAVRLGQPGGPCAAFEPADRLAAFDSPVVGRHLGAGGQVGRFCLAPRVVAGDRFAADTRLALDAPIAPAQFEQRQYASFVGHLEVVPHRHPRSG